MYLIRFLCGLLLIGSSAIPALAEPVAHMINTTRQCHPAEFYFFARIFGISPADHLEPLQIENLDS